MRTTALKRDCLSGSSWNQFAKPLSSLVQGFSGYSFGSEAQKFEHCSSCHQRPQRTFKAPRCISFSVKHSPCIGLSPGWSLVTNREFSPQNSPHFHRTGNRSSRRLGDLQKFTQLVGSRARPLYMASATRTHGRYQEGDSWHTAAPRWTTCLCASLHMAVMQSCI